MNCETFMQQLDDWLDAELPEAEARAMQVHAASCAACATRLAAARDLQARVAALPREREPARDLWPEIASRLTVRRAPRNRFAALAAGLALLAVFAGGMLAERVLRATGDDPSTHMADSRMENRTLPSIEEARRILPASYVQLVEGGEIGSTTEQELLRNLLLVNLAIREIETAAAEHPADTNLRELLSSLYAQENRILTQAQRLRATGQTAPRTSI